MSDANASRVKYDRHLDLPLTIEQYRRAAEIARFIGAVSKKRGPVRNAGIRFAIDFCFTSLLSQSSTDAAEQSD